MFNISHIAAFEPAKLHAIHNELVLERMKMDKKFSAFLDKNKYVMGENLDDPVWKKYRKDLKKYSQVIKDITLAEFYLKRN